LLFRRIKKSEKNVSTASSNVTSCAASLSLSKSYSKSAGSNASHFTTVPFYSTISAASVEVRGSGADGLAADLTDLDGDCGAPHSLGSMWSERCMVGLG